jgi:rhodanese-related sulfurtransferase
MTPFPLPLTELLGQYGSYVIYLFIGIAFGWVLEIAGFGKSTRLAAQFYLKDMTVLKVMFTGIVIAMLGVFFATAIGLLDYNLVWVNPTYMLPGIVGGLIMGVGFIIGGFCPGTSLVAAATLKIDGIMFALGAFFGIFVFGETVGFFEDFWYSTDMGRFTLMELFNTSTGVIVLGVVLMALAAFAAGEFAERYFGDADAIERPRWRFGAAGAVVVLGAVILIIGQPTNADKWERMAETREAQIAEGAIQIHPAEVLEYINDSKINTVLLDVRSEYDFNQFHLRDARHVEMDELASIAKEINQMPENTVTFIMSNGESRAIEAWKFLVAESVINIYVLEGGINNWITVFAEEDFVSEQSVRTDVPEQLAYTFPLAIGDRHVLATPNPHLIEALEFDHKVVLNIKRGPSSGGCG